MALLSLEGVISDIRQLEELAGIKSPLHQLDPRAKLLVTLLFIVLVISWERYAVAALLPFFLYPLVMTLSAELPLSVVLTRVALVLPFVLLLGGANLFFDRTPVFVGNWVCQAGWFSLLSLVLRAVLTIAAAVILIATTGFHDVCHALQRFGMPQALVTQLQLMYRYLFVLAEEAAMTARARRLRSFGNKGMEWRPFAALLAHLLLRSWERAERIHSAMLARGGGWQIRQGKGWHFGRREVLFVSAWGGGLVLLRLVSVPHLAGELLTRLLPVSGRLL